MRANEPVMRNGAGDDERCRDDERRRQQALAWMHELIQSGLEDEFRRRPAIHGRLPELEKSVRQGRTTPFGAARELLALFFRQE